MEINTIEDLRQVEGMLHDSEFREEDFGFNSDNKKFQLKSQSSDSPSKKFCLEIFNVVEYSSLNLEKVRQGKAVGGVFDYIKIADQGLALEIVSQDLKIRLRLSKLEGRLEISNK